jgi:hypothetical protein
MSEGDKVSYHVGQRLKDLMVSELVGTESKQCFRKSCS